MFAKDSGYEYSSARITLVKLAAETFSKGALFIGGNSSVAQRDTYLECQDLEEGQYFLLAEIDWVDDSVEQECNITSYGPTKINF